MKFIGIIKKNNSQRNSSAVKQRSWTKIEELAILKGIYRDTYNLSLKYKDIDSNQKDWGNLIREIGEISNKYNNELCNDFLASILKHIESEYNKRHVE